MCVNVQVLRVVDFCCQFLEKEVSEDNYLYLQELALQYSLERLEVFIDRFILTRFSTLALTPEFLRDIPSHKLILYLSSRQVKCSPFFICYQIKQTNKRKKELLKQTV